MENGPLKSDKLVLGSITLQTLPFFPIAFPSSLYSTNHHGFVVVGPGVVDVVAVVGAGVTTAKARKTIYILDGKRKRQHKYATAAKR